MPRNRLLFLTSSFPDFPGGYRGSGIFEMSLRLAASGWKMYIVTPRIFAKSPIFERMNGIYIWRFIFPSGGKILADYKKTPYLRMSFYILSGIIFSLWICIKKRISLINAHFVIPTGFVAVFVSRLLSLPLVITAHGSDILSLPGRSVFLKRIAIFTLRRADRIIAVSERIRDVISSWGIPQGKIVCLPIGIDESCYLPDGERENLVISIRNLNPVYNVETLVRAVGEVVEHFPEARFLIVGDGTERERLEALAARLGVANSVDFRGRVPREEIPRILSCGKVYVSTSLSDGTSVSLLEALASGIFPVVSDIPANTQWITNGENGYLFPRREPHLLAQKIVLALKDDTLRRSAREKNRHLIEEKGSWNAIIPRIEDIYRSLLK